MKQKLSGILAVFLILMLMVASFPLSALADTIPSDVYRICVVDDLGNPLEGCTVDWDHFDGYETKVTNSEGYVDFNKYTWNHLYITVRKSGYITWRNDYYGWKRSEKRIETVTLYPIEASHLRLISAVVNNDTDVTKTVKKMSLGSDASCLIDDSTGPFKLDCKVAQTYDLLKYELYQGDEKIAESQDGSFDLNTDQFKKGSNVYVLTYGKGGIKNRTSLMLEFYKITLAKDTVSLNLGQLSIGIPDSIPFVGGDKLEVNLPCTIPLTVVYSEDKIRIGFGVNMNGSEKDRVKSVKETGELLLDLAAMGLAKPGKMSEFEQRRFNRLVNNDPEKTTNVKWFKSAKIDVLGYAEVGKGFLFDSSSNMTVTGNLVLRMSVDIVNFSWTTWVVVLPVTVNIKATMGLDVTTTFSFNLNTGDFSGQLMLSPYLALNVFGGVGIGKACGVGAYGSAKLTGNLRVMPDPQIKDVSLTGELGIKAYIWIFSYSKAFAHHTWDLWTNADYRNDAEEYGDYLSYVDAMNGMNDASQYALQGLSYLEHEGTWIGSADIDDPRIASNDIEDAEKAFTTLISGTYRNARPVMVSMNGKIYAAFVRANQNGRVYTVVSCCDNGVWSELKETELNSTMVDEPKLCVVGNNLYLSYLRMPAGVDPLASNDSDTTEMMLEYAEAQELVVGRLDPNSLAFTIDKVYSDNGYLHGYDMYAEGDSLTVAWLNSRVYSADNVLQPDNADIYTATLSGTEWSDPQMITSLTGDVRSLTVGVEDGKPAFAYTIAEMDKNGCTGPFALCTVAAGRDPSMIVNNCDGRISFGTLPGTTGGAFIWNAENALMASSGQLIPIMDITSDYVIIGDSIYYSAAVDSASNLTRVDYIDGSWTGSIQMIEDSCYLENLNVVEIDGQAYVLGMNTTVTIDPSEDPEALSADMDDSKDIVFAQMFSVSDLELDDIVCDYDFEEDTAALTLYVNNDGDHNVSAVEVWMDGQLLKTESVNIPFDSYGEIPLTIPAPWDVTSYHLEVREPGWHQHTHGANIFDITLGYSDFTVDLDTIMRFGSTSLSVLVENEGISSGEGKLIYSITEGDKTTVFMEQDLYLERGELYYQTLPLSTIPHNGSTAMINVTAVNSNTDLYAFNNTADYRVNFDDEEFILDVDTLYLPGSLTTIADEAFEGDTSIISVVLNDNCETIGSLAFANCSALKQIRLTNTVSFIADDAFAGCENVVLWCPYASYAASYAKAHNLKLHLYAFPF